MVVKKTKTMVAPFFKPSEATCFSTPDRYQMYTMTDNAGIQAEDAPIQNPSVRAHGVGNNAVLHDWERNQVFSVTALAKEMWSRCDGATPLADIGQEIGSSVGLSLDKILNRLRQIASELNRQDLLFLPCRALESKGASTTMNIIFGNHQVEVRTSASEFAQVVQRLFCEMIGESRARQRLDVLDVWKQGGKYYMQGTRGHYVEDGSLEDTVRTLKHKISRRFKEARSDLIWLHAGAVSQNGTSVLVAGEWGSGKSTVVANLYRAGWKYLSDDRIPYDPDSGQIFSFPVPPAYRKPEEEYLSKDELAGLPKEYINLESPRVRNSSVQVNAIVFPAFKPDRPGKVEGRDAEEAAVELACGCLSASRYHGDAVEDLCRLADQVPAFQLQYSSGSSIASALASVIK